MGAWLKGRGHFRSGGVGVASKWARLDKGGSLGVLNERMGAAIKVGVASRGVAREGGVNGGPEG